MKFFKNIGIKFFGKQLEDEVDSEDEVTSHIEFVDYRKIGLLKLYFINKFCLHNWKLHMRMRINVNENGVPQQITDTLICKKCGKITKIDL
jgi:hypothetical protein